MMSSYAVGVCVGSIMLLPGCAFADLLAQSRTTIDFRNYYINSDYRSSNARQSKAEEWAQGIWIKYESGFTDGDVGVGLDFLGQLGVKLDSSRDDAGTMLLPRGDSGESVTDYSKLGATLKAKYSKSILKFGQLQPLLPVATYNDTRLMPASYEGVWLSSRELNGLELNAGKITSQSLRDSAGQDKLSFNGVEGEDLDFAGGALGLPLNSTASYYWARMEDVYSQHYVGLTVAQTVSEQLRINYDIRYFVSHDEGGGVGSSCSKVDCGVIDNRFFNGMVSAYYKAHRFSVGYQDLSGKGDFPFAGQSPYSVNLVTVNTFAKADTEAWQVRYDYDFVAMGIPGLSFMARYVTADNIRTAQVSSGRERERDTDLMYVVQSGPLQGLNIRLRNASFRSGSGLSTDIDENRVIIGYSLAF